MQFPYNIASLSETAMTVSFEQVIDEQLNTFIVKLGKEIQERRFAGLREIVVAYASLTIYYDAIIIHNNTKLSPSEFVKSYIEEIIEELDFDSTLPVEKKIVEIPVKYDGEDLKYACTQTGFSEEELIELHTAPLYRVFMMGFLPGFAYLGGMDKRLAVPRRASPRLKVPVGSVGIAGEQTGIYPMESPGGWQLIGRTEMPLFTPNENEITLLKQGVYVKFMAI